MWDYNNEDEEFAQRVEVSDWASVDSPGQSYEFAAIDALNEWCDANDCHRDYCVAATAHTLRIGDTYPLRIREDGEPEWREAWVNAEICYNYGGGLVRTP